MVTFSTLKTPVTDDHALLPSINEFLFMPLSEKKIKQINAQPHPPGAFPFNFEGKTRPLPRPSPFQEN